MIQVHRNWINANFLPKKLGAGGKWPERIEDNHAFVKFTDGSTFENIPIEDFSIYRVPGWLQPLMYRKPVGNFPQVFIRLDEGTHLLFKVGRETDAYDHYYPKLVEIHYKRGNVNYYYSADHFQMHIFPHKYYDWHLHRMPPLYHAFVAIPNSIIILEAQLRIDDEATRQARVREARAADMDTETTNSTMASQSSSKRSSSSSETSRPNYRRRQF